MTSLGLAQKQISLAPDGVFATIQGEGAMLGVPMVFVRTAGCSVGCPRCDTNYQVNGRASPGEIAEMILRVRTNESWVWLTGGEPTDQDFPALIAAIREASDMRVALATSGIRQVESGRRRGGPDFLSVSPHDPATWRQTTGDQLNLVPGLNGFSLADFEEVADKAAFSHRFVTPCDGKPETVQECLGWVRRKNGWRMGVQAHKTWGVA